MGNLECDLQIVQGALAVELEVVGMLRVSLFEGFAVLHIALCDSLPLDLDGLLEGLDRLPADLDRSTRVITRAG